MKSIKRFGNLNVDMPDFRAVSKYAQKKSTAGKSVSENRMLRNVMTFIMYEGLLPRTPTGKVTKYVLVDKYSSKV